MISRTTCRIFNEEIDSISGHPAAPSIVFPATDLVSYSLQEVCKMGYSETAKEGISVACTPKNIAKYPQYRKEFEAELAEYKKEDPFKHLARIEIPYKDVFGEPWKFDHVEYWGEICFVLYRDSDLSKYINRLSWEICYCFGASGRSYEEMMIRLIRGFKKKLGECRDSNFYTEREKKYEQVRRGMDIKERIKRINRSRNTMPHRNPAVINRRWMAEFLKTAYCQQTWIDTVKELLNKKVMKVT